MKNQVTLASLLFSFVTSVGAADNYSAWKDALDLFLDTTPGGAALNSNLYDFPILVRLKPGEFPFEQAKGKGEDVRITKPDGTPLQFEIEHWDSAGQSAEIWVKVDTVRANFKGQFATIYWGNALATPLPAPAATQSVFDSANGYVSVFHMGGKYPSARLSSVPGGLSAIPANYDEDENSAGIIGLADSLDGHSTGD